MIHRLKLLCFVLPLVLLAGRLPGAEPLLPLGSDPPGGLPAAEIPQFILITFDDAVTEVQFNNVAAISRHQNPDGSPVGFTFYISLDYTDYWMVHRLHAAGHEIAVHTVTHTTGVETSHRTWIREIEGTREALHRYAGVPREEIRGFRAPYLAYNPAMFQALHDLGFLYDSSVSEQADPQGLSPAPDQYIRPYSMDQGLRQVPNTGIATDAALPNLVQVPMWKLMDGAQPLLMDPLLNEGRSVAEVTAMLRENFQTRYQGNRVPLALWLHPSWIVDAGNVAALNDFLAEVLALGDVWVVPVATMVDWELAPLPAGHPELPERLARPRRDPVPIDETFNTGFARGTVRTVGKVPVAYPHPDTLFLAVQEVPLSLVTRWEILPLEWSETQFEAQLFLASPEEDVGAWRAEIPVGNNLLAYGWSAVGGTFVLQDGVLRFDSRTGWDPGLTAAEKLVGTFSFTADPAQLGNAVGTTDRYVPVAPRVQMISTPAGPRLSWTRTAPLFTVEGRSCLRSGDWQEVGRVYGSSELPVPAESPVMFYRVVADP